MTTPGDSDRFTDLVNAWNQFDSQLFDRWVIDVSTTFFLSGLTLKMAANLLETQPAELQAVVNLAALEEESLGLLTRLKPPNTTWFSLAAASSEGVKAAAAALAGAEPTQSPFLLVDQAIRSVEGPNMFERIAGLRSEVFGHAAKKAQTYSLLNEKGIKALNSFKRRVAKKEPLTPAQMAYADGLLRDLVEAGAISRKSKDKDQGICDVILDALGYE